MQVSHAAINELIREAELLGSLRHPNVVWVYGIVLPPVEEPQDSEDLDALIDSAEPIEIASAMSHQGPPGGGGGGGGRGGPGQLRPPAIITEFMSQGSLKGALSRRLEVLQPPLMRLMVALDAAKVSCPCYIMTSASTAKVVAEYKLKYYRISECATLPGHFIPPVGVTLFAVEDALT